jgi:hypothetical protein
VLTALLCSLIALRGQKHASFKTDKSRLLSAATLAAGSTAAESINDHRTDSIPARPNHKTATHHERMGHKKMCDSDDIASCCERMQQKMCSEMKKGEPSEPCREAETEG